MGFDPVVKKKCGGCNGGLLRREKEVYPHLDCGGTGLRVPKNFGRPVKAQARRGQPSPWVYKAKAGKK